MSKGLLGIKRAIFAEKVKLPAPTNVCISEARQIIGGDRGIEQRGDIQFRWPSIIARLDAERSIRQLPV
jgi:hypothetical protein